MEIEHLIVLTWTLLASILLIVVYLVFKDKSDKNEQIADRFYRLLDNLRPKLIGRFERAESLVSPIFYCLNVVSFQLFEGKHTLEVFSESSNSSIVLDVFDKEGGKLNGIGQFEIRAGNYGSRVTFKFYHYGIEITPERLLNELCAKLCKIKNEEYSNGR